MDDKELEDVISKDGINGDVEKCYYDYAPNALSISAIEAQEEAEEMMGKITALLRKFHVAANNIMLTDNTVSKEDALAQLSSEFQERLIVASKPETKARWQPLSDLVATFVSEHTKQTPVKVESGIRYTASDYACVPDPKKPSTWKLKLADGKSGNITTAQLGRAAAALSEGGYRGQQVSLPNECSIASVKERIRTEYKKLGVVQGDMPNSVKETPSLYIWKDNSGKWQWLGVYSNKWRDDDSPPEILSDAAHRLFVEGVQTGKYAYPDLYVWHIPLPIGKSNFIAYDSDGFPIIAGYGHEEYGYIFDGLTKSGEDLAMSHGMPGRFIKRDKTDSTVIVEYVSTEVSVLPRAAAANKMTYFYTIDESQKERGMAIPDEQRKRIAELIGEEATVQFTNALKKVSEKAIEEDIECKESVSADTVTEPVRESDKEESPEVKEESNPVAETSNQDLINANVDYITRDQLIEVAAEIISAVKGMGTEFNATIDSITSRLEELNKDVGRLKESDGRKIAEKAASTPQASLSALIFESVVGREEAAVDGRTKLAKSGPVETEEPGNNGLFFEKWLNA